MITLLKYFELLFKFLSSKTIDLTLKIKVKQNYAVIDNFEDHLIQFML